MPFQSMDSSVLWLASLPLLLSLLCVDVDGATIIPSYAAAFVNAHNVKRCMHGVPLMSWSSAVEATAVTWAATCSGVHTNLTVRMNDWFGENLWGVSGMEPFPQGAVKLWYDEISMYDWSIPILQPGTGHLTQVIWRESVNLGCAMCDRGDGWKWVVCQYNPPGNAPGDNELLPPIKSEAECIAEILPNSYNCVDDPVGWTDSVGRTCATYAQQGYCQPDGTVGPNWNGAWGPAATYASQGKDAFQACCACGGGRFVSPSPSATPSPSPSPSPSHSIPKSPPPYVPDSSNCVDDPVGWKDSYGWACSSYLSDNWCTTDGATGSGWQSWWGPISRYANQGKDAFAACCACGGGKFVSPSPSLSASPYTPSPSPSLSPSPSASPTSPSRSPSPPPMVCVDSVADWKDMYGFSCAYWVSHQFCTPTGTTGAGWQPDWGSPSLYPCQGQTAMQACCGCGGGTWIPAPSRSGSPSPLGLPSPSQSPSASPLPSGSASASSSPSSTPSPSASPRPSGSASHSPAPSDSPSPSSSSRASASPQPSPSAAASQSPSVSAINLAAPQLPATASASPSPSVSPGPLGTKCADEGGICSCTGLVQFGIGTTWSASRAITGQVACTTTQFGDPRPGKVKACYCLAASASASASTSLQGAASASPAPSASGSPSPGPSDSVSPPPSPSASPSPLPSTAGYKCADELGMCSCTGLVQFGVGTTWSASRAITGQVACTTNQFGDPRPGKVKACYCLPVPAASPSTSPGANIVTANTAEAAVDGATTAPSVTDSAGASSNVWPWLALPFALLVLGLALGALFCLHRHRRAQLRAETFLDVEDITAPPCLAPTTCASPKPMFDEAPLSDDGAFSPAAPPASLAPSLPPSPSPSPVPADPYDV